MPSRSADSSIYYMFEAIVCQGIFGLWAADSPSNAKKFQTISKKGLIFYFGRGIISRLGYGKVAELV